MCKTKTKKTKSGERKSESIFKKWCLETEMVVIISMVTLKKQFVDHVKKIASYEN